VLPSLQLGGERQEVLSLTKYQNIHTTVSDSHQGGLTVRMHVTL
jgi:hypothetical protein